MRRGSRERGEGRAGLVFAIIVVAASIFAGIKFVPVYVGAYDLRETVRREAQTASIKTDKQIRQMIVAKALEKDFPIQQGDVIITRPNNAKIVLKVDFRVPIDLALFTFNYHYKQKEVAPLF